MSRYSPERKAAILKKLLPPQSMSVREVFKEEGIHFQTLYSWLNKVRGKEISVPNKSAKWSAEAKFSVVVEAASLSEAELSQYFCKKGLFVEQVKTWKQECLQGFKSTKKRKATVKM